MAAMQSQGMAAMKYLAVCVALMMCASAQAATYVYQSQAYQSHHGHCGDNIEPFQMTITLSKPLPPSSSVEVPLKTIMINAGVGLRWKLRFMNQATPYFSTDGNGNIINWQIFAFKDGGRIEVASINEVVNENAVGDSVFFKCGYAQNSHAAGTWTRTK